MTSDDSISYTMACYLIDGLNINNHSVSGTNLAPIPPEEGHGYRALVELAEHGTLIEHTSRLGWFEAAEGCVRQVLRYLGESQDSG